MLLQSADHMYLKSGQSGFRETKKMQCSANVIVKELLFFRDYKVLQFTVIMTNDYF
jgi:hypothetical protein